MNTKHNVPTALPSTGIRLLRDLLLAIYRDYHNDNIQTNYPQAAACALRAPPIPQTYHEKKTDWVS